MRRSHAYQVSFIAIAAATMLGQTAFAQTTAPGKGEAAQAPEEVVVVARRVNERLQNVPLTVTAVSEQKLKETQVNQGTDLIKLIPTLSVQQMATGPGVGYAIRGIRDGVVTYFNEIPLKNDTAAAEDQIWDLNSVQALAGPQGTLFGQNATGGIILFVPQRPTDKFGGYIDASYGNFNYEQLNAVVNLPVNDMLQLRLGYRLLKHDPMVKNIGSGDSLQSENRNTFRASAVFTPNSHISNYTVFDYGNRDEKGPALITSGLVPTPGFSGNLWGELYPAPFFNLPGEQSRQNALGIRTIDTPYKAFDKATNYGVSNILTFSITPDLTLKYIFGYRYWSSDEQSSKSDFDVPIEVGNEIGTPSHQWTNEVQLLGKLFDNRINWAVGYFNNQQTVGYTSNYQLYGEPGQPFAPDVNIYEPSVEKNATQAGYAQATFAITPKFNFTAGVRYTADTASSFGSVYEPANFFTATLGPGQFSTCGLTAGEPGVNLANCTQSQSLATDALTYNLSLDYHLSERAVLYFTTRKGYNVGGFNPGAPAVPLQPGAPGPTYKPEYVTDYEVGAKTEGVVAGMPFRANLSGYFANYTDIQREQFGYNPAPYTGFGNGPAAEIYGFQLESMLRPTHHLTLTLNYGFLRTLYTKGAPGFPEGNTFGQAPEHTINFSATYRHPLPAGGSFLATVDWTFQSKITFMDNQVSYIQTFPGQIPEVPFPLHNAVQSQYGVADMQVGWESVLNSPVDVILFVKNLTNTAYAIERQDQTTLLGFTGTVYNDPRTFGVTLHYHFGN